MNSTIVATHAHLGNTLLIIAILGFIIALFAKQPAGGLRKAAVLFLRLFGILLSVQWVLGIINYVMMDSSIRPGLMHPIIMTIALVLLHILTGRARKSEGFSHINLVVLTGVVAAAIYYGIGFA